jgi:hypothetical protein
VAGRREAGVALCLKASAACLIVFSTCCDRFERSQSKNALNDGGATSFLGPRDRWNCLAAAWYNCVMSIILPLEIEKGPWFVRQ